MSRDLAVLLVIVIPLVVVWVVVTVDIALQPRMPGRTKAIWIVLCTVVWPMQVLYMLTRPNRGLVERQEHRSDAHAQLVAAVLDHEGGRLDDDSFGRVVGDLRARRAIG